MQIIKFQNLPQNYKIRTRQYQVWKKSGRQPDNVGFKETGKEGTRKSLVVKLTATLSLFVRKISAMTRGRGAKFFKSPTAFHPEFSRKTESSGGASHGVVDNETRAALNCLFFYCTGFGGTCLRVFVAKSRRPRLQPRFEFALRFSPDTNKNTTHEEVCPAMRRLRGVHSTLFLLCYCSPNTGIAAAEKPCQRSHWFDFFISLLTQFLINLAKTQTFFSK